MYDLILRDIINDEVTRLSNAKMDAIISALKKTVIHFYIFESA